MKNVSAAYQAALLGARDGSLVPVTFVWFRAKNWATGLPEEIGLWTWDEDINVTVLSGTTGLPVTRTYYGAVNLEVSDIPYVSDLTVQTVTIGMSQIADAAQQLVRGYDLRLAKCEIHEMTYDTLTGQLSSAPEIAFIGEVVGAPINTPSIGNSGSMDVSVISDAISMLTRTNPAKSSHEGQRRRDGDDWGINSSTISTWGIPWGRKTS
ncbi:hypothetical protein AGRO_2653 [Agrobacterium sp. ATCC 31749]|uniref:hypothetical protein n=1 Tax=unclassified Agrobacterium TaxID=2632611 RepID=UPI00020DBCBF|nr:MULTISPECIES: hypothetical protein [unclassified Agrobacterium]EGL64444.1 hypothetical protein AGRO_2653 [Agrobacterium sp. ATCC 31749]QKW95820.1 hypothetical protein GSF67_01120 [Agrobacterium sp. CGMCC 11546]